MVALPSLRCVLQHWYELRLKGERLGQENTKRFVSVKNMRMVYQRQGIDALKGQVKRAARSEIVAEPVHLPVGAGILPDDVAIETFVRRGLHHERVDFRVAATYAGVFYMARSEEVAFILSERVILGEGDALVVAAARDALDIWQVAKFGGTCPRCGQTAGSPSTQKLPELILKRAS